MSDEWKAPSVSRADADLYGLNRYPPMSWDQVVLSFEGRIPRRTFWVAYVALNMVSYLVVLAVAVSLFALRADPVVVNIVCLLVCVPFGLSGHAILAKRWHDLNRSGWSTFWALVPVLGILYVVVMVGFVKGTSGRNEYGPGPVYS